MIQRQKLYTQSCLYKLQSATYLIFDSATYLIFNSATYCLFILHIYESMNKNITLY